MDDTTLIDSSPCEKLNNKGTLSDTLLNLTKTNNTKPLPIPIPVFKDKYPKVTKKTTIKLNSNESRIHNNELMKEIANCNKNIVQLQQGIKLLESYKSEEKNLILIDKWRGVCQSGMSYMLNSTLIKIDKLGGYEEMRRKEIDAEKRKIEYQLDDRLRYQMDEVTESDDFRLLSVEDQLEYKERMEEKLLETEALKEKQFAKLDQQLLETANHEMSMNELAKRLKIEFRLVFPEGS